MGKFAATKIRNICLCGHGSSGKTMLAEAMLYKTGATTRLGSVSEGSSVLDYADDEKERQYSINLSIAYVKWQDVLIQVVDTPGYPDFIGETISGLSAVETAVVTIDTSSGIKVNTRRAWEMAKDRGLGRLIAITKIDLKPDAFAPLVAAVQETFGSECVPLVVPSGGSVVNLLGGADIPQELAGMKQALVDKVIESNDQLMEKYLEGTEFSDAELAGALSDALAAGMVVPIVAVGAQKDIGVKEFMNVLADATPGAEKPLGRKANKGEEEVELPAGAPEPFLAQVFKLVSDPYVGKLAYFRVYSGKLTAGSSFHNSRTGKLEKAGNIHKIIGKEQNTAQELSAGEIGALAKVEDIQVSDTMTTDGSGLVLPAISYPLPMVSLAVTARSKGDAQKIGTALNRLAGEDKTFVVEFRQETSELVVIGNSSLHLDVMLGRLKSRFNIEVDTKIPRIAYRETITAKSESQYRHKKQTGGRGQFGEVFLRMEPLERGGGLEFVNSIVGGAIPQRFIPAVEKGVKEAMQKGSIAGFPVQDVKVELHYGSFHAVDSDEHSFRIAGKNAFLDGMDQARPALLEPIADIEITTPTQFMGDITGDLNSRRGRIQGMDTVGDMQVILAKVPLAEIANYSTELRSMTGGEATYTLSFSHYDVVPGNITGQIVEKVKAEKEVKA
jgi:elongation factor G